MHISRIKRRLEELEKQLGVGAEPIRLYMPDGTIKEIPAYPGIQMLWLFSRAMKESASNSPYSRDVALIVPSVSGTEPGGHVIDLMRAVFGGDEQDREGDAEEQG